MTEIAHLRRDWTVDWNDAPAHIGRVIPSCGDLVLDVYDCWDTSNVHNHRALQRWAEGWRFSLAGISGHDAVSKMLLELVLPVMHELVPEFAATVDQLLDARVTADELLDAGLAIPSFPVRIDGHAVRVFLADVFDGPFDELDEQLEAVLRRSVAA